MLNGKPYVMLKASHIANSNKVKIQKISHVVYKCMANAQSNKRNLSPNVTEKCLTESITKPGEYSDDDEDEDDEASEESSSRVNQTSNEDTTSDFQDSHVAEQHR